MKKSAFILLGIVLTLESFSQVINPDRCVSFDKQGNQVIFNFENKSKLQLPECL